MVSLVRRVYIWYHSDHRVPSTISHPPISLRISHTAIRRIQPDMTRARELKKVRRYSHRIFYRIEFLREKGKAENNYVNLLGFVQFFSKLTCLDERSKNL